MATKHTSPRYALGLLFVAVVALVPLKIFRDDVIRFLSPYMGGKPICPGGKAEPSVVAFGPKDSCLHVNQSADTLVQTTETVLLVAVVVLSVYIFVKVAFIIRGRRSA